MELLPHFIGIGAPKAGTTWIYDCLSQHPEIALSSVKETEFWKFEDSPHRLKEYAEYFAATDPNKIRGEFSVRYMSFAGVPKRMKEVLPDVRLIAIIRNPVEQVQSWYWHLRRQGQLPVLPTGTPQSLLELVQQRNDLLLKPAFYFEHLQRWWDQFPKEQLLILMYEDIKVSPEYAFRKILEHIGADSNSIDPCLLHPKQRAREGVSAKSETHERFHRIVYGALNRFGYRPLRAALGSRRAGAINAKLGTRRLFEQLFFKKGYSKASEQTIAELRDTYRKDVLQLEKAIERDLSEWGF